jgi:protein transport protein SEC31
MVGSVQVGDYQSALMCHAQMVSQGNFSEISQFMPSIKTLMQTATQMGVYVQ